MAAESVANLQQQHCKPCEGGVKPFSPQQAIDQVEQLDDWDLNQDSKRIRKFWEVDDFMAGMRFLNAVAGLAEEEGHHPDLCLKNYKDVTIELTTHAIDGLSENDFILAAKIDRLYDQHR